MTKTTKTKTTGTGDGITKRWAVVRKSTGSIVRKFTTRRHARLYKTGSRTLRIYDTATATFVR